MKQVIIRKSALFWSSYFYLYAVNHWEIPDFCVRFSLEQIAIGAAR
jgi:hypothetical protein